MQDPTCSLSWLAGAFSRVEVPGSGEGACVVHGRLHGFGMDFSAFSLFFFCTDDDTGLRGNGSYGIEHQEQVSSGRLYMTRDA